MEYEYAPAEFQVRLKQLIQNMTGGSVGAFSAIAKMHPPTVRRWLSGETEPGRTSLVRLAAAARVSVGWLVNGEGETPLGLEPPVPLSGDTWEVPLFEHELSAGPGREPWADAEPSATLRLPGRYLRETLRVQGPMIALRVSGDSMEPTVRDGAVAVLDTAVRRIDRDGQVYALAMDGALLIKRAHWLPATGVRLAGDNPASPPVELDLADAERLIVLGRVACVLNRP